MAEVKTPPAGGREVRGGYDCGLASIRSQHSISALLVQRLRARFGLSHAVAALVVELGGLTREARR